MDVFWEKLNESRFPIMIHSTFPKIHPSPKLMIVIEWTLYKQLSILIHPNNSPEPFTLIYERSKVIIKPIPNHDTFNFSQNTSISKVDDSHRMDSLQAIINTDSSK